MSIDLMAKLADLDLTLPDAPAPAANYVPYVQSGAQLFISGQISNGPDGLILGKLGADMTTAEGAAAALGPSQCRRRRGFFQNQTAGETRGLRQFDT